MNAEAVTLVILLLTVLIRNIVGPFKDLWRFFTILTTDFRKISYCLVK